MWIATYRCYIHFAADRGNCFRYIIPHEDRNVNQSSNFYRYRYTNKYYTSDESRSSDPTCGTSCHGQLCQRCTSHYSKPCTNCHGGEQTEEGLVLLTYPDIMAGSDNGPVVIPGDAEHSLVAEMVATQKMPKRGPKLTPPQMQVIIDWINQGALDN